MNRFGCIILAAGASRRMGGLKQLLPLEGKALVIRAAEAALESAAWPVVIVVGAQAEKIRPGLARLPVLAVDNPAWPEGMASSIRAGIAALQEFSRAIDAALIALCDQPAFSSAIIEKFLAVQRESASSIVAAHYGGRRGAPALFLREHFATLGALTGDEGARALLNDASGRVATVDLPDLAVDLDTPEDYATVKNGFPPP
jgi:molybdenum cofactor cytidylyltransferase